MGVLLTLYWVLISLILGAVCIVLILLSTFLFLSWSEMSWITPTSQALGLVAQNKLLKHFVKTPFEVKSCNSLNYVEFKTRALRAPGRQERVLVLMHGYGSGLGFFFDNYDALSSWFDRVIAVDWHGMGLSSRTEKPITRLSMFHQFCKQESSKVLDVAQTVTNEFIDSLESLRVDAEIPRFVLAGHSLGGFLSAKYALKYPNNVEALILVSPVGIPLPPPKEELVDVSQVDWKLRLIDNMWKMNFTPQNIVRVLGPKGPSTVTSILNRRFASRWTGEDLGLISDYFYQVTAAPGSGEYALNALLEPKFSKAPEAEPTPGEFDDPSKPLKPRRLSTGVYARQPLEQELCRLRMPMLLMYGDHDWLAYPTVEQSLALWKRNGVKTEHVVIPQAGHHLYNDNAVVFNNAIIDWVKRSAYLADDAKTSIRSRSPVRKSNLVDVIFE